MATLQETYVVPPNLAIAEGATTPDPGGVAARGAVIWSTITGSLLRWSGTAWGAVSSTGGGGLTYAKARSLTSLGV
jgi:hypothetical protein